MRVLDLFSGIGGFSLGLERAGMRTVQFVECDPFCQHILRQHWPDIPIHDDIRTFHAPAGFADVICGGFPCQDISVAGRGAGLAGERSGLWSEYARVIGEVRPRFAIVENVSALLSRGLGDVLRDLAALGYDAEWHCIPASAVGAPHRRDRVWIVAHANRERGGAGIEPRPNMECDLRKPAQLRHRQGKAEPAMAYADKPRLEGWLGRGVQECARKRLIGACRASVADAIGNELRVEPRRGSGEGRARSAELGDDGASGWWLTEPDVGRVAHGVPARVDRLRSLGNAVVPQIPEIIGRAIMAADGDELVTK